MLFTNSMLPEHCRSLFLGDLSCFCQDADVYRFFQPFGEIEEIRIKRNHDGIGLGYGFITFARRESAELAMRKDGEVLVGRPVRVSWATARGQGNFYPDNFKPDIPANNIRKRKGTLKNGPPESAQIHFSFISKQTQRVVTEAIIREVFSHFGEVKDVTIKKTTTLPRTGQQTGYGFLDYPLTDEGIQSALQASRIVKQVHIYDILYDCCLTWDLEEIIARRKKQQQQMHDVSQGSPNSSFYSNQLHSESTDTHSILHSTVSSNSLLSDSSCLHGRSISDSSNNSMQPSFTTINTSNYDSPYIPDRQYRSTSFPPNHHHQQYPQQSKQQYPESRGMYFQNSHSMEPPSYHQSIPFSTYSASTLSSAVSNHPYQGSSSYQQPY